MVTGRIERFTPLGIKLESGEELEADIIVTATGLKLKVFGGIAMEVDGAPVDPAKTMAYKGLMISDVPNMAFASGYTNAAWTLKVDITCEWVCRLLNHMNRRGYDRVVPRQQNGGIEPRPLLDLKSGYVQRAMKYLPKQGHKAPWRLYQNYLLDAFTLRHRRIEDGTLELGRCASS